MDLIGRIKESNKTFVIAEIGQNHQGDIDIAKQLIKVAKDCGADCVKFQKTCLEEKFTRSALSAPYSGPNSWGRTYGEHKRYLEFTDDAFIELQKYAQELDILFTASAMDVKSLEFLERIRVPFIKIGSGDVNNMILIEKAARYGTPLVISTGMADFKLVKKIYSLVSKYHKKFGLLHCVSSYPSPYEDINLNVINLFKNEFKDVLVGYSGHEIGINISVASVALGAQIIERHITLNKTQKGSDHKCSLEPREFKALVHDIRILESALGQPIKAVQESEQSCYQKLGKSLVYSKNFDKEHVIGKYDVKIKVSVPKGLDATKFEEILGRKLICSVLEEDPVYTKHFSE